MVICPKCEFTNPDEAEVCARCGGARYVLESPALALAEIKQESPPPSDRTPMPPQPEHTLSYRRTGRTMYGESKPSATPGTVFDQPLPQLPSAMTVQNRGKGLNFRDDLHATITADSGPSSTETPTSTPPPPAPPPPVPPQLRVRLVVLRGVKIGAEYPIYEGRNTLGRFVDKPVDVDLLTQESVEQTWCSRVHAAVTLNNSVVLIEDLNSLNGTWINGTRIHPGQQRVLKPNDVVQVGTVQMKLIVD